MKKAGVEAREVAIQCLYRIDETNSFANIILPKLLEESSLDQRDKNLITEIVYGTTRMRRALDWVIDRYLSVPPPTKLRSTLRAGAYQIIYMRVPNHAAVSATVSASSKKNKGVVNAILRRISEETLINWPNEGTKLSYPEWIIELLTKDLGETDAFEMLGKMNEAPAVSIRDDGYYQDLASQWITELVGVSQKDLLLDLCAAPGGKATALAAQARKVVACDINESRHRLIYANKTNLSVENLTQVVTDGRCAPFTPSIFDHILVDAPCSGLGVLHRRADSRWRIEEADIKSLAKLQTELLESSVELLKSGGVLTYSVCTVTNEETVDVVRALESRHPNLIPEKLFHERWRNLGNGLQILPKTLTQMACQYFNGNWQIRLKAMSGLNVCRVDVWEIKQNFLQKSLLYLMVFPLATEKISPVRE